MCDSLAAERAAASAGLRPGVWPPRCHVKIISKTKKAPPYINIERAASTPGSLRLSSSIYLSITIIRPIRMADHVLYQDRESADGRGQNKAVCSWWARYGVF